MVIDALDTLTCLPLAVIESRLERRFGEYPVLEGNRNGLRVTLYMNPGSHTFTILMILPTGEACWLIAGENLQPVPRSVGAPIEQERAP